MGGRLQESPLQESPVQEAPVIQEAPLQEAPVIQESPLQLIRCLFGHICTPPARSHSPMEVGHGVTSGHKRTPVS